MSMAGAVTVIPILGVISAKAGIQFYRDIWTPACAGVTLPERTVSTQSLTEFVSHAKFTLT